ncbi:MAG: hypothetical protein WDM81_20565 [Rhizomicrobium sp.]
MGRRAGITGASFLRLLLIQRCQTARAIRFAAKHQLQRLAVAPLPLDLLFEGPGQGKKPLRG